MSHTPSKPERRTVTPGPTGAAALPILCILAMALCASPARSEGEPLPPASGGTAADPQAPGKDEAKEETKEKKSGPTPAVAKPAPARTAPAKAAAAKPAAGVPATAPEASQPAYRFTDDDLADRYHKPVPPAEGIEEDATVGETEADGAPSSSGAASGTRPAPRPTPAPAPPPTIHKRRNVPIAPPLGQDPLKTHHDREAKEKFRSEQIERIRAEMARLRERLAYLKAKRLGILNPLIGIPAASSDEEKERDARLKPNDLLATVDQEIEAVQTALEEAESNLVRIETRFEPGP